MDEVLFRLAYLLQTIKKEDQAREFFLRLIKDYPNSKYVPDAYLSFAQYFFDKGEMDARQEVLREGRAVPQVAGLRLRRLQEGLVLHQPGRLQAPPCRPSSDVIRLAQSGKAGGNKLANQALEREAKKDVVKAYARTPGAGPDKAWEFFNRVGGDFAPKMMEALAELYWEQGMFGDSTKVYHKMMVLNPESPRLCEWQNKVVRNTLSAGTKRDQVQEVNRLGIAYDRVKAAASVEEGPAWTECRNAFHDISKELALVWHKEAQRTKNPDTYVLVRYVYKDYLDRFAKEKGALDMAFYYAEVLWTTQQWREAAEQYTKVVEIDPQRQVRQGGGLRGGAGLEERSQHRRHTARARTSRANNTKDFKPQPIPEYQKKMIAAFDTYIKYVPDAPELVTIKYRKARIFYDYNHFDEAAGLFQDIVDKHSDHELAEYSANLLLDSLNIQGEHLKLPGKTREALRMVDKFMDTPALMKNPEFAKNMVNLKVDGLVIEAKQYEEQGNYKECGRSMLAAAESMPDHPKHAERLYDVGGLLPERAPRRPGGGGRATSSSSTHPERSAGAEGAVQGGLRLPPDRLLQRGRPALRAVRQQVPGREGGGRRPQQRLQVPGRHARVRSGDQGPERLHPALRRPQAARGRRRVLPDGRGLREGEPGQRPHPPPRELPQAVGQQGLDREAAARPLQAGRVLLEEVLRAGWRQRRLHQDRARQRHRPAAGLLRDQQADHRQEEEDQGEGAHPVRPAHQVQDHGDRSRPQVRWHGPEALRRRPQAVRQRARAEQDPGRA